MMDNPDSMKNLHYIDNEGNSIDISYEEYLRKINERASFSESLNVGDRVRLRGQDCVYEIRAVHYEIPGVGYFDYAANLLDAEGNLDLSSGRIYYFNQKDIQEKVEKNKLGR